MLPCMLMLNVWNLLAGVAFANQPDQLFGHVNMQGSIIDSPCAIATEDLEQTVDMAVTMTGEIIDNGKGKAQPFSLMLINCVLDTSKPDGQHFMTTFDGPADDGLFNINGAEGVGLQIADIEGNIATPGKALPAGSLASGTQRLDYTLRLVRNHDLLKPGAYQAALRFKVDYY